MVTDLTNTPAWVREIAERESKATKGPWTTGQGDCARKVYSKAHPEFDEIVRCYSDGQELQEADAAFITIARNRIPRLLEAAAGMAEALECYDPPMPPALEGEGMEEYTNRLLGVGGRQSPYAERRYRNCSLGYHDQCSDPDGEECKCPCHQFEQLRAEALAKYHGEQPHA